MFHYTIFLFFVLGQLSTSFGEINDKTTSTVAQQVTGTTSVYVLFHIVKPWLL